MKSSWIGIGFSHHKVPSLSNTATRSSTGTPSDSFSPHVRRTKSMIACFVAPSRHYGSTSAMIPLLVASGHPRSTVPEPNRSPPGDAARQYRLTLPAAGRSRPSGVVRAWSPGGRVCSVDQHGRGAQPGAEVLTPAPEAGVKIVRGELIWQAEALVPVCAISHNQPEESPEGGKGEARPEHGKETGQRARCGSAGKSAGWSPRARPRAALVRVRARQLIFHSDCRRPRSGRTCRSGGYCRGRAP